MLFRVILELCSPHWSPFKAKENKQTNTHLEKLRIWNSRALGLTRLHCTALHWVVSCAHRPGPGVGARACAVMGRVHKARWWKHGHQFLSRCSCFLLKRALGPVSVWQFLGRPAHIMAVRRGGNPLCQSHQLAGATWPAKAVGTGATEFQGHLEFLFISS